MKFTIRNKAGIANKYIRFAKWKLRNLDQKFKKIIYAEIFIKQEGSKTRQYYATLKLGVAGPDLIITHKSDNLNDLWASISRKTKRQLRKLSAKSTTINA